MSPRKSNDASEIEVVWLAPPEQGTKGVYDEVLMQIKEAPGRWARVRVWTKSSPAYNAKRTLARRTSEDERWESKISRFYEEDGGGERFGLWIRYRTPEQMKAAKMK